MANPSPTPNTRPHDLRRQQAAKARHLLKDGWPVGVVERRVRTSLQLLDRWLIAQGLPPLPH